MSLPLPLNDTELETGQIPAEISQDLVSPWWYHIILSRTAIVYYHFIRSLRKNSSDLEGLVRTADEGLADIIEGLPPHLQPYDQYGPQSEFEPKNNENPWIKWQRVDLISSLLLLRSKINYECHRHWSTSPPTSMHRRVLCLESVKSVVMLMDDANMPIHQRRFM